VVFDDAFAYSDPERVVSLQRMLDLGAERGLQIIILTCNPADYAALGARQVLLRPAAPLPTGPSAAPPAPMAGAEGLAAGPGDSNLEGTAPGSAAGAEASPEVFLARLQALGGKAGNGALRDSLGWNETTYEAVKGELVANGRITPGRGRGGTITLAG